MMDQRGKEAGKYWGQIKRSPLKSFDRRGVIGRLMDEGEGACIRSWGADFVPKVEFASEEFKRIERVWQVQMTTQEANVYWLYFYAKFSRETKFRLAGLGRSQFYVVLDDASRKVTNP